jgi:hypothetical protein
MKPPKKDKMRNLQVIVGGDIKVGWMWNPIAETWDYDRPTIREVITDYSNEAVTER